MTRGTDLQNLLTEAEAIRSALAPQHGASAKPIRLSGLLPELPMPGDEWLLPTSLLKEPLQQLRPRMLERIHSAVQNLRSTHLRSCSAALRSMVSLELLRVTNDGEAEAQTVKQIEVAYARNLRTVKDSVERAIEAISHQTGVIGRKAGSFSLSSVNVLETAFSRCPVLSQRECSIVAKAAGITHQQVRTWFQNKRNRKRGGARNNSAPASKPEEEFIAPSKRIISSLPKRARQPPAPAETARPIRGLPKRGKVPSPSPSTSSVSTLESIAPAGGFQSAIPTTTAMPVISFEGSSVFDPSAMTYPLAGLEHGLLPLDGSLDYGEIPMYGPGDFEGMFNPDDFGNMLQEAFADPTLAISPSFTTSTSSTSPLVVPDEATKEAIDNMSGEELFAMLEQLLSKSSHSTSASLGDIEGLVSAELAARSGSEGMTPLGLSMLSFPSSTSNSPPPHTAQEPSTYTFQSPVPVDVAPLIYPQLDIYPATPKPVAIAPPPHAMTYQLQVAGHSMPTMQPQPGTWIQGGLPFDGSDPYYEGMWMMDGQGYTHPPRMGRRGVAARG